MKRRITETYVDDSIKALEEKLKKEVYIYFPFFNL
jgi:hypothetical protein